MKIRVTVELDEKDRWAIGDIMGMENRPAAYAECKAFLTERIEDAIDDAKAEFFDEPEYPPHHQPH